MGCCAVATDFNRENMKIRNENVHQTKKINKISKLDQTTHTNASD